MKQVTYRERVFLDRYKCVEFKKRVCLIKTWKSGGLLYGCRDRFNITVIALEDIMAIDEV